MERGIALVMTITIAAVWLINGLICKVLGLVPRHEQIVARILGESHARLIVKTIGVLEIAMALWVMSDVQPRWCALSQIVIVAAMNLLEFCLAPDLLLFGRFNAIVALAFMGLVFIRGFVVTL